MSHVTSQPNNPFVSFCCQAALNVNCGDEGTSYYSCSNCHKMCDVFPPGSTWTAAVKFIPRGFPQYERGGLLNLFRKVPYGWEDLGKTKRVNDPFCYHCGKMRHIGREQGNIFRFCPRCLIKTKEY